MSKILKFINICLVEFVFDTCPNEQMNEQKKNYDMKFKRKNSIIS